MKLWHLSIHKTKFEDNLDVSSSHVVVRNAQASRILFSKGCITLDFSLTYSGGTKISLFCETFQSFIDGDILSNI